MGILTKGEYTVTDLEDGKDAKLLYLTASSQVQAFDKDNKPKTTQAITISAKLQNASGTATFVAIPYIGNIAQTAITLGGTGNNRTLLPSQWTNTQWTTIAITATLGSLTDTISIIKVKDGITGPKGDPGNQGIPGTPGADGRTPYTHWAYAWSADGTDRFTTEYPRENLIDRTKTETGYVNAVDGTIISASATQKELVTDYLPVTPGQVMYMQQRVTIEGAGATNYGWWGVGYYDADKVFISRPGGVSPTVADGTEVYFEYKWTAPANAKFMRVSWRNYNGSKIKVEKGSTPTIYTPAPSEDYANAYPTYTGTYTDYTEADSTNPTDYTWVRTLGQTPVVHPAWSWSPDGTDRFTTEYPNLNLLDGTKDFSGTWLNSDSWTTDGTYKGLTVKKRTEQWKGIYKTFTAPKDGVYTFSAYVKASGNTTSIYRYGWANGITQPNKRIGTEFDWLIDSVSVTLQAGQTAHFRYEIASANTDAILWVAGYKWEQGNTPTIYTPAPSEDYANAYPLYEGTYTDYSETVSQNPADYTWRRIIGESGQDGVAGADGKGIKSTAVSYQASTSGTVAPTGTWVANPPAVTKGQYLWTRTIWTYTDNATETGYSVAYVAKDGNTGKDGIAGKDGVGIKSTAITYAVSSSGTTAPTSGWVANPPTATAGQFMWTRTVWTYTDNTTETGYSVGKIGEKGATGATGKDGVAGKDGVGIASTTINYAQSTSGTTAPTSGWSTSVPTLVKGQYLWTRTVWTYSDSTNETGYTVSYNAKDGNNGKDGIAGKDGVGIASTKVEYVGSSSGTVKPTTGWSTTIPTVAEGSFLWTKTTWTYTDSTTEVGYSVSKMGAKGAKGDQGIQGPQGPNGQTYYTWLKYADTPTTGMSDSPTNKKYMGLAYNKITATESTNYADYTWSLIQGPQGNQGIQGPAGANGQPTYTWIKYGTSDSGAGLSDDPTGKTYIGMAYNKTTATESTNAADYTWSLIQGPKGDNGVSVTSVTEEYYVSTSATTQTGGSWSTTVPNNANPNLYVWRRVKNTMSDGTFSYTTPALIQGMTGIYPYIGPTQPANPKEGQQWWKSDSNGNVTDFYAYHDGSWQGQTIQQSVLNIVALNAVNITGSTITGTTITGSEIINEFDYQDPNVSEFWHKGTSLIKDAKIAINKTLYTKSTDEEHSKSRYELDDLIKGLLIETATADGVSYDRLLVTSTGIGLKSSRYTPTYGEVNLRYQDLMTLPQKIITNTADGWTPYSTAVGSDSTPTCERKMRQVQLSGAFRATKEFNNGDSDVTMATLPVGYRPPSIIAALCKGSSTWYHMVRVYPDGRITTSRYSRDDGKQIVVNSWMKIDMTFMAGDI